MVLAASSLKNSLDNFIRKSSANVQVSYAGSQDLAAQILAGAPADVFVSAGPKYMDQLIEKGLVRKSDVRLIAKNNLAVISRIDLDPPLRSLADLTRPGLRLILGDPRVPVGKAAEEFARNWGARKQWMLYNPKFVASYEQSDLALVSKVRLGEADAAIVYQSDAKDEPRLKVLPIPDDVNVTVEYFAAPLAKPQNEKGAERFMELLAVSGLEGLLP
jgi:molybdate transport system substrate-binding protein